MTDGTERGRERAVPTGGDAWLAEEPSDPHPTEKAMGPSGSACSSHLFSPPPFPLTDMSQTEEDATVFLALQFRTRPKVHASQV